MNTLIVVEDDRIIRRGLTKAPWERIGVSLVGEASNGEEGIQLIQEEKPDVIISDINMPFMNGLDMGRLTREISPKSKIIFLTGYDEFKYAKEALQLKAFDYILKPVNMGDLFNKVQTALSDFEKEKKNEQKLAQTIPLLQEKFFQKLMTYGKEKIDIEEELANLDVYLEGPFYVSFLIHIQLDDDAEDLRNKDIIKNFISAMLVDYDFSILNVGLNKLALLVSVKNTEHEVKEILGNKLLEQIKKTIKNEVTITFGRTYSSEYGIGVSLIESQIAMDTNLLFQKGGVYSIDDNFNNKEAVDDVFTVYDEILENLIGLGVPQKLIETLHGFKNTLNHKVVPLHEVKLFGLKYITLLDYEIKKREKITNYSMGMFDLSDKINQSESADEVIDFLIEVANSWSIVSGKGITKGNNSLVEEAIQFMKKNYHQASITLQKVADELFVSAPYLSNLFKEGTGINFSDYLLELRMNEAMRLLRENDEKTYVIAERVGYKNPQYFSSSFKKFTGFSPKDYRNAV